MINVKIKQLKSELETIKETLEKLPNTEHADTYADNLIHKVEAIKFELCKIYEKYNKRRYLNFIEKRHRK
jgi:hypothetical protein